MESVEKQDYLADTKKSFKRLLEKLSANIDFVMKLIGILPAGYFFINYIYNFRYKTNCEEVYGIPGKYFSASVEHIIVYDLCMLVLIACIVILELFRRSEKKNNPESMSSRLYRLGLVLASVMSMIFVNVNNISMIIKRADSWYGTSSAFLIEHINAFGTVAAVLAVSVTLGFVFSDKLTDIKNNVMKNICAAVFSISLAASVLLLIYGLIISLFFSAADIVEYEFAAMSDGDEFVVITEYEGKAVVAPFEVDADGNYVFYTRDYRFLERTQGSYRNVILKEAPEINKTDEFHKPEGGR